MSSPASALKLENVLYEKKGPIAYVTIKPAQSTERSERGKPFPNCDPRSKNARDDSEVRGSRFSRERGDKSFAAGADISEMANDTPLTAGKRKRGPAKRLRNLIENLGKPVIAAVNGFALGGGCELSMASTIRNRRRNPRGSASPK